jgi:hypothetical protein
LIRHSESLLNVDTYKIETSYLSVRLGQGLLHLEFGVDLAFILISDEVVVLFKFSVLLGEDLAGILLLLVQSAKLVVVLLERVQLSSDSLAL